MVGRKIIGTGTIGFYISVLSLLGLPSISFAQSSATPKTAGDPAVAREVCEQLVKGAPPSRFAECIDALLYDFPIKRQPNLANAAIEAAYDRCRLEREPKVRMQVCERALHLAASKKEFRNRELAFFLTLSNDYLQTGRFKEAERMYLDGMQRVIADEGEQSLTLTSIYSSLSGLYGALMGNYDQALAFHRKEQALLPKPTSEAERLLREVRELDVQSAFALNQKKYAQAAALAQQALALNEKLSGPAAQIGQPERLLKLYECMREQNKLVEARAFLDRSNALVQASPLIPELPKLGRLAFYHFLRGEYALAEQAAKRSIALYDANPVGPRQMMLAGSITTLGQILVFKKQWSAAEKAVQDEIKSIETKGAQTSNQLAAVLAGLAWLQEQAGHIPAALETWRRLLKLQESLLQNESSEGRLLPLLQMLRDDEETIYWQALAHDKSKEARTLAMSVALLRKGRALEESLRVNQVLRGTPEDAQSEKHRRWQALRGQREQLLLRGPQSLSAQEYVDKLSALKVEADRLEQELLVANQASATRRFAPPLLDDVLARVAAKLPQNSALLEIVTATQSKDVNKGPMQPTVGERHYVGLLLFPNQNVEVFDIGLSADVETRVAALLRKLRDRNSDPLPEAQALYKSLITPMSRWLPLNKGVTQLYVSADGALNVLPLAALHDGKEYLLDHVDVHYLSTGRDLLREPAGRAARKPVLLADPDFEGGITAAPSGATERVIDGATRGLYSGLPSLSRLPGARKEVQALATLLNVQPLFDRDASEQALRQPSAPMVLHLATHGIFFADTSRAAGAAGDGTRGHAKTVGELPAAENQQALGTGLNEELSMSALLLAGASQAQKSASADQDGILTADEVLSLNLRGTQLVVLSACDTGRGVIRAGQGVYGLRRSFLIAGAESLLVSLWPVADVETGALILRYYEKLKAGQKTVSALREAMLEQREQRAHPYYWAPFIALGRDVSIPFGSTGN